MRKTKIICTIGPACEDTRILSEMYHFQFPYGLYGTNGKPFSLPGGYYWHDCVETRLEKAEYELGSHSGSL